MANVDQPSGFIPHNHLQGGLIRYQGGFKISAAFATALYRGDAVVLTSGYPLESQKLLDLSPDRTAFLHKPFTPLMLAETVDRLIGAGPGPDAD